MNNTQSHLLWTFSFILLFSLSSCAFVDLVNTRIGTVPRGQTLPAVGVPFGTTQWTPETRDWKKKLSPPFYREDSKIQGFRASHWLSGSLSQDYGSFTLMPVIAESIEQIPINTSGSEPEIGFGLLIGLAIGLFIGLTLGYVLGLGVAFGLGLGVGMTIGLWLALGLGWGLWLPEFPITTSSRKSAFDNDFFSPYYYTTHLTRYNITVQMTASSHVGLFNFIFPEDPKGGMFVVMNLNAYQGGGWFEIDPENSVISGRNVVYRIYQKEGSSAGFSTYFRVKFEQKFESYGIYSETTGSFSKQITRIDCVYGEYTAVYVGFSNSNVQAIVSTSFSDIDHARDNEKELHRKEGESFSHLFQRIKNETRDEWETQLSTIAISSSTFNDNEIFYSSLYHSMLIPRKFSDFDGTYPSFSSSDENNVILEKTHGYDMYSDFSLWSTFRSLHPLFTIIQERKNWEMMQSLVKKAQQGGWMPSSPEWNSYTQEMIGDHATTVITDAVLKAVREGLYDSYSTIPQFFDLNSAFFYIRKNAFEVPTESEYQEGVGRRGLSSYLYYTYIPIEEKMQDAPKPGGQVSRTLEYSYNDFVAYQLTKYINSTGNRGGSVRGLEGELGGGGGGGGGLGITDEMMESLKKRGSYWMNVIDPSTKFVRGRYKDGTWIEPFIPTNKHYEYIIDDGNNGGGGSTPFQYTWFVPHDINGLIIKMGGYNQFLTMLDQFFDEKLYDHSNIYTHHVPFLYSYVPGYGWKTQLVVRKILDEEYRQKLLSESYPAIDQYGQLSSWFIFGSTGLYPVSPGAFPIYIICSPLYDQSRFQVGSDTWFTIRTHNNTNMSSNRFISKVELNSVSYSKVYITHQHIMSGSTLDIYLTDTPSLNWGQHPDDLPPSMSPNTPLIYRSSSSSKSETKLETKSDIYSNLISENNLSRNNISSKRKSRRRSRSKRIKKKIE